MLIKQSSFLKLAGTASMLVLTAACAAPPQVPVVADRISVTQSANNGVEFCDLQVTDFTPAMVAQIRRNPNYERNLAIWLEQCPELALAFADFGTAAIGNSASGFVAGPGEGPDIEGAGSAVPGSSTTPGGPSVPVDPENPSVDPENPPVDPENPPVDPENPPVDPVTGQNPGNDKPVGGSPFDGENGEVPSNKDTTP
jgi:hypothetical protein